MKPARPKVRRLRIFRARGIGKRHQAAVVRLCRRRGPVLLSFPISTLHGGVYWRAPEGMEFIFIGDDTPVVRCTSRLIDWDTALIGGGRNNPTIAIGRRNGKLWRESSRKSR